MNDYTPTHYNESTILEFIIQNAEVSRSKLAKLTNLTKSSISDITKTLIEKSLVYELNTGMASVSGGRKPIYLSFNNECALVIAIEIGKDYIHSSLSYINGELVNKLSYHSLLVTKDTLVMLLTKIISDLTSKIPQTPYGILGIGMAIHGIVKDDTVLFTPYSDIDSIPLKDLLAKEIPYPIVLINEANAGALGEYTFKTPSENLVNINIQDGIGAGIVENGKLFIGANGTAGEVDTLPFTPMAFYVRAGIMGVWSIMLLPVFC